jgi:hypothetical protein
MGKPRKRSSTPREVRQLLIEAIQTARQSHVITYFVGDRPGVPAQIGEDAVRPMYEHLRAIGTGRVPRIDLFLYSRGGAIEVPWRIISMLREYGDEINVLVPYKAHSAATLIALGADHIVMGKKGELGPIDPIFTRTERSERSILQEQLGVEDVMSYIAFIKERAGLGDQAALAGSVSILAEKLNPWIVGSVYRAHSHIRLIARKLLGSWQNPLDEQRTNLIVDALAEKMYMHGHAIGRREAQGIGLPVEMPDGQLEETMWRLFEAYEQVMRLQAPVDARNAIPSGHEEHSEPAIIACIESIERLDVFRGGLAFRHIRQMPPQLNLSLNVNLQLPPSVTPEQLPQGVQTAIQQMLQTAQKQMAEIVQGEIKKQAPIQRTEGGLVSASWQEATAEGI